MINQNKMRAVEFLESEMQKLFYITKSNKVKFDELIQQAKEMEKEQIEMAFFKGKTFGMNLPDGLTAEQYYNETFKTK